MEKLNPEALASCGDQELDTRPGVQYVDETMIRDHVIETGELPRESAGPFADWLDEYWDTWNEDGDLTNAAVIAGALAHWRGQA